MQIFTKTTLGYLMILPALYTMLILLIYVFTGSSNLIAITPLKSILFTVITLILMPTISFVLNTSYQSYVRKKTQVLLSFLIVSVWMFNVILLISACTNS